MGFGSLQDLVTALQAAPTLASASVIFGEENIFAQEYPLPLICIVPLGGPFTPAQGYVKNPPAGVRRIWSLEENIEIVIWTAATDPEATAIDHANAVENAAAAVLQAFEYQRSTGLTYKPVARRWQLLMNGESRMGRALVLTVAFNISVINVTPPSATVTGIVINDSINGEAATS